MNLRFEISDFRLLCAAILFVGIAAGCDEKKVTATPRPQPTFGQGAIRGKVIFTGPRPVAQTIRNEPCCTGAPKTLPDETIVVNAQGELANVLVYLSNIAPSDGSQRPAAVLDQKFCRYQPHVLGVQVGQTLRITSSDPTLHNVHIDPTLNPAANFGMSGAGSEQKISFQTPEFIRIRCDVPPWMNAYVGVFDSPFFAVTGADGSFEIKGIPPGQYEIKAWHERYGEQAASVAVGESSPASVNFEYRNMGETPMLR